MSCGHVEGAGTARFVRGAEPGGFELAFELAEAHSGTSQPRGKHSECHLWYKSERMQGI